MSVTEKKAPNKNTGGPAQGVNPALLVNAPKLPSKFEFSYNEEKKEHHNDKQ